MFLDVAVCDSVCFFVPTAAMLTIVDINLQKVGPRTVRQRRMHQQFAVEFKAKFCNFLIIAI